MAVASGPVSDADILAYLNLPENQPEVKPAPLSGGDLLMRMGLATVPGGAAFLIGGGLPRPTAPQPTDADILDYLNTSPQNQELADQQWQERFGRSDTLGKTALSSGLGAGVGLGNLEKAAGSVHDAPGPRGLVGWAVERIAPGIGGRLRERGKARVKEFSELQSEMKSGPVGDVAHALTATAVASAPTIPAAALGGVPAAAVVAGTQSFGQTFSDAKDYYGNDREAFLPAMASGLVTGLATAGFGKTGIEALRAGITRGTITQVLNNIGKHAGWEGIEEWTDQVGQTVIQKLSYNPKLTLEDAAQQAIFALGAGGLMGAAVVGGAETAGRAVEGARNIVEERQFQRASRDAARRAATFEADPALSASAVEKRNVFEQTPGQQSLDRLMVPNEVAGETGWSFRPNGAINLEGLPPELAAQMPKQWEFTDRREGSPTMGFTVYTPEGATADQIREAIQRKTTEVTPPAQPPAPVAEQPVAPRIPRQRPEVPGTPAEERKTVLQEIRDAQAMTIGQIQALFPQAQLTREQARVYRRMAWPEIQEAEPRIEAAPLQESRPPVPATGTAKPKTLPAPTAPAAQIQQPPPAPVAQTLVPQEPPPQVVPPPVAPAAYPDAPQFPLKPLESGWVDARGLPVEMVPDTTHPSGNRWRVKAAQPQPVEETPKRPPAAAAPPKVSKLRERVATKKEPKGQIAKRIPKKPKPEVPVVETSPMDALMQRIAEKEKAAAPAAPEPQEVEVEEIPQLVSERPAWVTIPNLERMIAKHKRNLSDPEFLERDAAKRGVSVESAIQFSQSTLPELEKTLDELRAEQGVQAPLVKIEKTEADVAPAPDNVMHDAGVRSGHEEWDSDKARRQAALGYGVIKGKWQKVTKELLSIVQADVRALNKRRLEHIARMKDYVERFGVKPTDDIDELTFRQQTGTSYDQQTIIEFVQRLETAIRSGNEYVRGLEKQLRRGERGFIAGSKLEQMATDYINQSTNKANLGVDPVLAVAGIIKGLAILENGIRDFAAWSRVMLDQLGDWVTPHLPTLYARALELEGDDKKLSAAKNLLKIKMAGMVTAQVPAIERAVAEIKAEILTRNQRGQAPILTGEALDRQRAFDAVAAHPLIRKHFIGPVDRMQEVMTATDGAFTTYREIKADPEATPQMQSAAAHIATKQLDGFYSELRRFQSSYQNKLEKLLEQVEKLNEAKAETAGESEVLNVLLEDFQTFGKEIAYQSRDIGAVRAYKRALGQSGGIRNTLGFIAKFLDIPAKPTREDLLKAIEEHAQPFINDDRAFEQVVGAARETVDMVVDYIIRSEPLRARLKAGKEMLEDKAVSGGRNVLAPFKAALAAAVRAGNVEQAISIYTSGAGKTATERAKTKKLADFFKQKERALLNEMWAMGIVKTYVDQVTTSPTFQDLAKDVYSDLNVRTVNRGTDGIEYVLDPIFDEKPTKLFLKPDGSLLEQNTQALKTYHDNALVYLSDPDAPGYDHRKAAGLQALLDDWAQFTNPFFHPGARKFVESAQTTTYRTIFGKLGRIDLIPQFVIDKAGGMAANLAHRTLNAVVTIQELKIAIMRRHDPKLLRLEMAAMKSHKMKGDVDGYRDKIYAPLEESLQYFENIHQLGVGSPIGNGHTVTKEDMAYHNAVRAFEKDAMDTAGGVGERAFQSIKANPGGILYKRDGQTYIRTPAETGPGTVHRRLGRMRGWAQEWNEATTPEQKRKFINKYADRILFGYIMGVTNPKFRFTYRFADELRSIAADAKGGNPVASIEDLADRIMDKRMAGSDEEVTLADVQSQVLAEIDEMFGNYRTNNPTPKEGDKTVAWVFGGADSFNTERGNPIVPPLWYDYGSVTTSERLGFLHNMTAKFSIEHYNAIATLSAVLNRIVEDFETRAKTDVELASKSRSQRERGDIFYSWGEAKRVAQDVTDYLSKLEDALIFSAKAPDIAGGRLDPKSLVSPWLDVGVASALTGPSAMIMNLFGGGRSMAVFDRVVRNQSTIGSLLRNGKKFVAGSIREATRLMAHEGNPVGKAIGALLNNARTKPLIGAAAQTFHDYLTATRELYDKAATEGLHLNVDLYNTVMTEWMWRESGGVAGQTPNGIISRKILNPLSTAFRIGAEIFKQGGVGFVDSRLNVRAVRMEHDLEHDLKKRAVRYGEMRVEAAQAQGYDPYDLTDPRNRFSAKELVGGRLADPAALRFRQLLQGYGDINVDAALMAFHKQWVEAGKPDDLSSMQMFSEPQRRQLTLAIAADVNLATWATRPLAVRTGRAAAALGLFQGYPAWYMHKMAQHAERLTGKGWTRGQIESIPTMMAVAVIMTVVGSLGQGLVEEATRRLLNRQSRYPTIFDFNQSAKSYALTLLNGFFNQWAMVGDVGNAMIQRTFRRGFDFNSRLYYLNYATSVVDTLKEYWQTGRVLRPTLRFLQRWLFPFNYIGPHLPILSGLNEMNQTRNALTSGAHQIGMEARLKAPFSASDVTLTKSTGPLNDFMNAVGNRNMEGLLGAFTELVNVKREEGSADPVGAAIRAIQARNPVTQVFGAKPSPEEFQALFSVMRDDDVRRVKENLQFFDAAVQAIGGSPVSFTKEPGGGGGGGGGTGSSSSGSVGQGGIPAARRLPAPPRVSPGVFRSGGLNIGPAATFRLAIPRIRTGIGRLRGRSKVVRVGRGRRTSGRLRSRIRLRR